MVLEITQIGKECHTGCAIFRQGGKCIMLKEGVFARVIQGGHVRAGGQIDIEETGAKTKKISILRVTEQDKGAVEDIVVREFSLTIVLNNQELVTLLCSPTELEYLAVGFLLSQGLIKDKEDIRKMVVDVQKGVVQVETKKAVGISLKPVLASSGARGENFSNPQLVTAEPEAKISPQQIVSLMDNFVRSSKVFKTTGGVHSAALCNERNILAFNDDIGRHNAIDKVFGECLLKDIATDNSLMITSGRVSSEILLKVAKRNIPILISKAAPTDLGVRLAVDLGVTLVGFVRGKGMNVYANDWRIVADAG